MANLIPLANIPQCSTPTLRIYRDYCTVNRSACELLGIKALPAYVQFRYDTDNAGRRRLYLRRTDSPSAWKLTRKEGGRSGKINSRSLCRMLARRLNGFGAYRICEEVAVSDDLDPAVLCYEIFFKRLGQDRTE